MMVDKGNHPQMALIQVGELLEFTQMYQVLFFVAEMPCVSTRGSGQFSVFIAMLK